MGGVAILRSPANRLALSRDVLSISRKRSISLGTGSIGMESVAKRTWDAVLKENMYHGQQYNCASIEDGTKSKL